MANRNRSGSPTRNRLSDRDMLLDMLTTEKYMSHLYDHAIMEAADDSVRDTFITLQQDDHDTAQMIFDFMQQQGWYNTGANRQQFGRRLQQSQPLSGGMQPRADSRYAAASGARNFGQNLGGGRQGSKQMSRAGHGKDTTYEFRPDWNS